MSWTAGRPVQLETARYRLRSLVPDAVGPRYLGWLRDPEVIRYLNARFHPADAESVAAFVASHDDDRAFLLGIFDRADDSHVGNFRVLRSPEHRRAELGVMIGERAHWGRGVVQEVRAAVLDFLFEEAAVEKVIGSVYAANAAAIFNYQAQGFRTDGVQRDHVVLGEGRCDLIHFAMFAADWAPGEQEPQ